MNQKAEHDVELVANGRLRLFDLRSLASFREEGPSVRIVSDDPSARLVLLSLKEGQQLKEHHTKSLLFVQVVQGRVTFGVLGKSVELEAGTIARVEASTPHHVTALSDAVLLLTMSPSPAVIQRDERAEATPYSHL